MSVTMSWGRNTELACHSDMTVTFQQSGQQTIA